MSDVTIKCRKICKTYGDNDNRIDALKDVNLDIYSAQLTLLVGPSGSGKTTLLSIITGILTPDCGDVILLGNDIRHMSENDKANFFRKM